MSVKYIRLWERNLWVGRRLGDGAGGLAEDTFFKEGRKRYDLLKGWEVTIMRER